MDNEQLNSRQREILVAAQPAVERVAVIADRIARIIHRALEPIRRYLASVKSRSSRTFSGIWESFRKPGAWLRHIELRVPPIAYRPFVAIIPFAQFDVTAWVSRATQIWEHVLSTLRAIRRGLLALAELGWFPDSAMPSHLLAWVGSDPEPDSGQIDEVLAEHFEDNLYGVEEELVRAYPERRQEIRESFGAHREEWYTLSTRSFFALADGIWEQECGRSLFAEGGPNAAVAHLSDAHESDESDDPFWLPLSIDAPLWRSKKKRAPEFKGLNRHEVMHGESTDYGTRVNSQKAMSLAAYVYSILHPLRPTAA